MISTKGLKKPLLAAAAAIAALAVGAQGYAASPQPKSQPKKANWTVMVTETNGGHLLGNPDAPNKLVEFMSYTCSHCADFARKGDGAIRLAYIPSGKISYEIRHLIRDPVDLTAALLTQCGPAKNFTANHMAIMVKQDEWLGKARTATQAQMARWQFGTNAARFQAIASDLGFYDIMANRGYDRPQLDRCLSDEAKAKAIAETSRADAEKYNLEGTPSFLLNGTLLDAHNWEGLQPYLDKVQ